MAQITWRNVDAPNFNGAVQATGQAGDQLARAASALSAGLGQFDASNRSAAANQLAQNVAQYQDAAALQGAIANGNAFAGVDTSKLSPVDIAAAQQRVATLGDQARAQYAFARQQTQNANADNARQALFDINAAAATGNPAATAAAIATGRDAVSQLTPEQQQAAFQGSLGNIAAADRNTAAGMQNAIAARTDAANQAGLQAGQMIESAGYGNAQAYDALTKIQDPNVRQAAANYLQSKGYTTNLGPVGSGGSIPMSGPAGSTANGANVMTGGASLPSNINTIGDLVNGKSDLLKTNPKGTATGLYQMTADTWQDFAPKALGANWQSANVRDPKVQDQVAQSLWDSVKNDPAQISARWASITPAQAQAMQGKDWSDVRGQIAQNESGTDPLQLQASLNQSQNLTTAQSADLSARKAQNVLGMIDPKTWNTASNDTSDIATVVDKAVTGDGVFKGTDRNYLLRNLQAVLDQTNQPDANGQRPGNPLSPAQGLAILQNSLTAGSGSKIGQWFDKQGLFSPVSVTANGQTFDPSRIGDMINRYQSGQGTVDAVQQQQLDQAQQSLNAAQQMYGSAQTQLAAINAREAQGFKVDPSTKAAAQAQANAAQQMFEAVLKNNASVPYNQPQGRNVATKNQTNAAKVAEAFARASAGNTAPTLPPQLTDIPGLLN